LQPIASKAARNMYNEADSENAYVVSDLPNSYMWDTALIFITKAIDSEYSKKTDGNGTLKNTGEREDGSTDKICNIYDLASNLVEHTTEYSSFRTGAPAVYPGVTRGGYYKSTGSTPGGRGRSQTSSSYAYFGFRVSLYCAIETTEE